MLAAYGVSLLLVGTALGYALERNATRFKDTGSIREGGYTFINPLIACDVGDDTPDPKYDSLKRKLSNAVDALQADQKVARVSVYVREMDSGSWTGVNVNDAFIPASLMKLPLAIAYFKQLSTNASLASTTALITGPDANASEIVQPSETLTIGTGYPAKKVVAAMLIHSDNNAAAAVQKIVAPSVVADVYDLFGIPAVDETSETMSPRIYMRLFRILYNASYLGRANSENVLKLLAQSSFTDGIAAGVPTSTIVAHKFGEREIASVNPTTGTRTIIKTEFHDCGIVYYPKHPYGICVMTEGTDLSTLEAAAAHLSAVVYESVAAGLFGQ